MLDGGERKFALGAEGMQNKVTEKLVRGKLILEDGAQVTFHHSAAEVDENLKAYQQAVPISFGEARQSELQSFLMPRFSCCSSHLVQGESPFN